MSDKVNVKFNNKLTQYNDNDKFFYRKTQGMPGEAQKLLKHNIVDIYKRNGNDVARKYWKTYTKTRIAQSKKLLYIYKKIKEESNNIYFNDNLNNKLNITKNVNP